MAQSAKIGTYPKMVYKKVNIFLNKFGILIQYKVKPFMKNIFLAWFIHVGR